MWRDADPVAEFRDLAARYVALIEAAPEINGDKVLLELASLLPALYGAAVQLPRPPPDAGDDPSTEASDEASVVNPLGEYERVYHSLAGLPIDYYWSFEPDIEEHEDRRGVGSLADDLTDIYLDLKEGFDGLLAGRSERDVGFHWRLMFWIHWGCHAVDAMAVIHRAIQGDDGPG